LERAYLFESSCSPHLVLLSQIIRCLLFQVGKVGVELVFHYRPRPFFLAIARRPRLLAPKARRAPFPFIPMLFAYEYGADATEANSRSDCHDHREPTMSVRSAAP
jgi:hypothetical protein